MNTIRGFLKGCWEFAASFLAAFGALTILVDLSGLNEIVPEYDGFFITVFLVFWAVALFLSVTNDY